MKMRTINTVSRYMLIACLSVALLISQMFRLHLHIEHDEASTVAAHLIETHTIASLHDRAFDTQQDDTQDHHTSEVDVSTDSFVKKVKLFSIFMFFFLFISTYFQFPRLCCIRFQHLLTTNSASLYNLLHPPLRAPPL